MSRNCYYHPDNTLHNFCINTECALPLCPKCINIHLNQSSQKHHIQSLSQTRQMIRQQLETSIEAIEYNLNAIKTGEYTPEACAKQYTSIVQKYRQQAINMINEHYDYIKRELFEQLKSKFICHLGNLIAPLEENVLELKKHRKSLEQKPIQCMIKIVSQQTIVHVQKLLEHIAEKKQTFKMELPRLEGIEGNKLKIIPGGIQRVAIKSYHQTQRHLEKSIYSQATNKYNNQVDEFDRINRLEAELNSLRV